MDAWWIYEVPNAQATFDAVVAIERAYTPGEITGPGSAGAPTSRSKTSVDLVPSSTQAAPPPRS